MPGIQDVARRAGVSKSTVSRVMNGGSVSGAVRASVNQAIAELGYHPNAAARGLATKSSGTIGVMVADISDPYYSRFIRGVDAYTGQYEDFDILLYNSGWQGHSDIPTLRKLMERKVDGLLAISYDPIGYRDFHEAYLASGPDRPLVLVEGSYMGRIPSVGIDNAAAADMAVAHLVRLGHHLIAHLCGPLDRSWGQERLEGYRRALARVGIPGDEGLVAPGDFTFEGGYAACRGLLRGNPRPTAIFAANDLSALGAWKAVREAGLSVPEDIALVGFDDIETLTLAEIPLTTVRQPRQEMGFMGAQLLFSMIRDAGAPPPKPMILPVSLEIRESCGYRRSRNVSVS